MKTDSVILLTKAVCYVVIGVCTPLGSSLAQWVNSGETPPKVVWFVIAGSCLVGGATQLLAFFSSAYKTWTEERPAGGTQFWTKTKDATPDPAAPAVKHGP